MRFFNSLLLLLLGAKSSARLELSRLLQLPYVAVDDKMGISVLQAKAELQSSCKVDTKLLCSVTDHQSKWKHHAHSGPKNIPAPEEELLIETRPFEIPQDVIDKYNAEHQSHEDPLIETRPLPIPPEHLPKPETREEFDFFPIDKVDNAIKNVLNGNGVDFGDDDSFDSLFDKLDQVMGGVMEKFSDIMNPDFDKDLENAGSAVEGDGFGWSEPEIYEDEDGAITFVQKGTWFDFEGRRRLSSESSSFSSSSSSDDSFRGHRRGHKAMRGGSYGHHPYQYHAPRPAIEKSPLENQFHNEIHHTWDGRHHMPCLGFGRASDMCLRKQLEEGELSEACEYSILSYDQIHSAYTQTANDNNMKEYYLYIAVVCLAITSSLAPFLWSTKLINGSACDKAILTFVNFATFSGFLILTFVVPATAFIIFPCMMFSQLARWIFGKSSTSSDGHQYQVVVMDDELEATPIANYPGNRRKKTEDTVDVEEEEPTTFVGVPVSL